MSQQNNNSTTCSKDSIRDSVTPRPMGSKIADFDREISKFSYCEIEAAINKFARAGLTPTNLGEEAKEHCRAYHVDAHKTDICYFAWDYILQQARNKIYDILKFDMSANNGGSITTIGNSVNCSYKYVTESMNKFKETLREASVEQIKEIKADKYVKIVFEDIGIDIEKIRESKTANKEEAA